jgi:hypothetical protein
METLSTLLNIYIATSVLIGFLLGLIVAYIFQINGVSLFRKKKGKKKSKDDFEM